MSWLIHQGSLQTIWTTIPKFQILWTTVVIFVISVIGHQLIIQFCAEQFFERNADIELLDIPRCNLSSRDAVSAIQRCKTVRCQNEIAEFVCRLQSDEVYPKWLPNYSTLTANTDINFVKTDVKKQPDDIRILYMLTVFGRDHRQILRLLNLIYRQEHFFIIHVDARSEYLFKRLEFLAEFPNIHLLRQRESPIWGGARLLTVLLSGIQFGLTAKNWNWDYFINLSESDLPIKPNDELLQYLYENFGKNFLKSHGTDTEKFTARQGLDKTFYQCENRMWRIGSRRLPENIIIDGGSDWLALHRDFCQYLFTEPQNELIRGLLIVFNYTLLPAESFFHTVLQNSQFSTTFTDNNLRFTNWKRRKGCNCQYKHIVDWCGCSPNVFRLEDFAKIENFTLRPIFFARKFDPLIDFRIIKTLLEGKSLDKVKNHPSWSRHWLNIYSNSERNPSEEETSLFSSLCRLSLKNSGFASQHTGCQPVDVHVTVDDNNFLSLLIAVKVLLEQSEFVVEARWNLQRKFSPVNSNVIKSAGRLRDLKVSTDFDQKEEMFRNYLPLMGPFSEPSLALEVDEGCPLTTSVVWIDPVDIVAGSFEFNISAEAAVHLHKPIFQGPLRPGIWTVYVMQNWRIIGQTKFLIVPISQMHNVGPKDNEYIRYNFSSVAKLLKLNPNGNLTAAEENRKMDGLLLEKWMDDLVNQFFLFEESCVLSEIPVVNNPYSISPCSTTNWSSYFPDLKSMFVQL